MSVGLLIITHDCIGQDILKTATDIFGDLSMPIQVVSVTHDVPCEVHLETTKEMVQELDSGDGVLILTDIFGATPSNIAVAVSKESNACVVAGINLPMVIRVLNYSQLPLNEIIAKATSAGCDSIFQCNLT